MWNPYLQYLQAALDISRYTAAVIYSMNSIIRSKSAKQIVWDGYNIRL